MSYEPSVVHVAATSFSITASAFTCPFAVISFTSRVCSAAHSTLNVAVYVVVPFSVHVAGVLTADVIVAFAVST